MKRANRIWIGLLVIILTVGSFSACSEKIDLNEIEVIDLTCAVGAPLPDPSDFVMNLPDGVTVRYAKEYRFDAVGSYTLKLVLSDEKGNELKKTVRFTLIIDDVPPTISGAKDISVSIGDGISYKSGVTVSDNLAGATLTVDSSNVDLTKEGRYVVRYVATDVAGNVTTVEKSVYVYEKRVTLEMLNEKLDAIIDTIITPDMTKEEKCRRIYYYVYDNVSYVSISDKADWVRAAYDGLSDRQGDCFTYYALSKAFFERLGIENMCIQRTAEASQSLGETHFWNYVNIGDAQNPQWYHFDTTHLNDAAYTRRLVLITEAQLQRYNNSRKDGGNFYRYDRTGYPVSATGEITALP